MKIRTILERESVSLSFEVFPPKQAEGFDSVERAALSIASLKPDFMSVTYGAGGTTAGLTLELTDGIQKGSGVPAIAHLTCVGTSRQELDRMLEEYRRRGIETVLALRGDIPRSGERKKDFLYAEDLVRYIKAHSKLCIGAACYPEGHVESQNKHEDLFYLRRKVNAGCDFLTTQMFFDNNIFYNFLYRAREAGILVPVIAGIMPITNAKQLSRSVTLSGTGVPERLRAIVDRFGEDPVAMEQAGIIYASEQIIDLVANGIRHIHVYSMNKPQVARRILQNLSCILGRGQ
ncbi:MAG: methylenetetrahydrofolate reductase [Oscillospiraceae bacterium]|nr:methylenetetrahydrofolate reductase [NAD(P)H] [Oscillospiraceae bacterium]